MSPKLDELIREINDNIGREFRLLVADCFDTVAKTQYEAEPDALYSGVEVADSLKGYAQAIREGGELNTGAQ